LLRLNSSPDQWKWLDGSHREAAVRERLGCEYFFDRKFCDRETVASFCLPKLNLAGTLDAARQSRVSVA
jgi:hypothetical protein